LTTTYPQKSTLAKRAYTSAGQCWEFLLNDIIIFYFYHSAIL